MKKLIRTGALLFGACLVWAAGAKADCVRPSTVNIGEEARGFVAGGQNAEARGNSGVISLISSGSENGKMNEAFGMHGYTLSALFHHSEGVGDDDGDGSGWKGSDGNGSSGNCGHGSSTAGGGTGVVSTPEPSSILLLLAGLLGLFGSAKVIRVKTA